MHELCDNCFLGHLVVSFHVVFGISVLGAGHVSSLTHAYIVLQKMFKELRTLTLCILH